MSQESKEEWKPEHVLGFCGSSVQKLERMMLDVDNAKLLGLLNDAKQKLVEAYRLIRHEAGGKP